MQRTLRWASQQIRSNEQGIQKAHQALEQLLRQNIRSDFFVDCATAAVGSAVARMCHRTLRAVLRQPHHGTMRASLAVRAAVHAAALSSGASVFLYIRHVFLALGVHTGAGTLSSYVQLACAQHGGDTKTQPGEADDRSAHAIQPWYPSTEGGTGAGGSAASQARQAAHTGSAAGGRSGDTASHLLEEEKTNGT